MKKAIIAILFAILAITLPSATFAEEEALKFTPQINIGESITTTTPVQIGTKYESSTGMYFRADLLPKYIQAIYQYGQGVVGILAVIILMVGGVMWITSAGDSGKIGKAKKMILGSITGIIILFSSWIILNTINPDLTNLQALDIKVVDKEKQLLSCCKYDGDIVKNNINEEDCTKEDGTYYKNSQALYDDDSYTTGVCTISHSCCQYPKLKVEQDVKEDECISKGGTYYENSTAYYEKDSTTRGACVKQQTIATQEWEL